MKVYDNIDLFIEFAGDADEKSVAGYRQMMESHLNELSLIRGSKDKTEKYFKEHIWPEAKEGDRADFKEVQFCYYDEGEGKEVKTHVDRESFIAALKRVIRDDQISYSYINSLLEYGCAYSDQKTQVANLREARKHYRSKADIQYAIEFDLEKIKASTEEKKSPEDKIQHLQEYLESSKKYEGVSEDVKEQVEFSIELLIENIHKELDIFEKAKLTLLPDVRSSEEVRHPFLLFYNFWGDKMPEYQQRAVQLKLRNREQNSVLSQPSNSEMLVAKIVPLFRTLKETNSPNADLVFAKTVEMLGQMMMDFSKRTYYATKGDFAKLYSEGKAWMAETRKCIAQAYTESLGIQETFPKSSWEDTSRYKNQLQQWCGGAFIVEMLSPSFCPYSKLTNTILYNFWGNTYNEKRDSLLQKFILTDEEENMVDFTSNAQYFCNKFSLLYATAKTRVTNAKLLKSDLEYFNKMVTDQANDFIIRLNEGKDYSEPYLRFATDLWLWLTRFFTDLTIDQDMDKMYLRVKATDTQAVVDDKQFLAQMTFRSRLCDGLEHSFTKISKGFDRFITSACKQDDGVPVTTIAEIASKAAPVPKKVQPVEPPVSENITYSKSLTRDQQEALHAFLHQKMDSEKDYHGFAAIYAAIELTYLKKPTFPQVSKEFDIPTSKEQNYSGFMGKRGKFAPSNRSNEHTDLIDGLKDEIKALPAFNTK